MPVSNLQLKGFRNLEDTELAIATGLTVFYGNNAQGKTNILEALYLLLSTRSFKGADAPELIKRGQGRAVVGLQFSAEANDEVQIEITMDGKRYTADGGVVKSRDLFGRVPVVFFSPLVLDLFFSFPDERRKLLDFYLAMSDKRYLASFWQYTKVLKERNRLLYAIKKGFGGREELAFWDSKLVEFGAYIINKRAEFVDAVNAQTSAVTTKIGIAELYVEYVQTVKGGATAFAERLAESLEKDITTGHTGIGPHRDDLKVVYSGKNVGLYGSRGEQRLALVTLFFMVADYLQKKMSQVVLLLDDVFAELDAVHKEALCLLFRDKQVVLTTLQKEEFGVNDALYYKVEQGAIVESR